MKNKLLLALAIFTASYALLTLTDTIYTVSVNASAELVERFTPEKQCFQGYMRHGEVEENCRIINSK